ncbi:MAG: CPBP family intramembrane glutamic endopeptidase [Bdellovibrionota bacterium]|nr:CPBP family intramembrane glutamic endopeptidase [Bdellovibrionota bacterium]
MLKSLITTSLILLLSLQCLANSANASSEAKNESDPAKESISYFHSSYKARTDRPCLIFLPSLGSWFLPGLGQYIQGNWQAGLTYSLSAAAGISMYNAEEDNVDHSISDPFKYFDENMQRRVIGSKTYDFVGSLSAYQSFRSRIKAYENTGEFAFIKDTGDDEVGDIMLAPFDFSHLKKKTTWIPLAVIFGLGAQFLALSQDDNSELDENDRPLGDASTIFSGSLLSYQAGVGEEALFRGFLQPYFRYKMNSNVYANLSSSAIFGALHYSSDNPFPIAQAAMGYYLGWLTQRNGWSIRESAFLHTWWDVVAINISIRKKDSSAVYLPALNLMF